MHRNFVRRSLHEIIIKETFQVDRMPYGTLTQTQIDQCIGERGHLLFAV